MARFTLPRDLYHGKGALEALKTFKGKKAMICVGGGSMKRFGFLDRAEQYLRKGMEEGLIREVSIPVVMAMVKGTVICFMESDVLYQNELTYEQAKKEMVEILMKGIKAGGKS